MLGPVTMIILRYGIQVNRIAGLWTAIGTWVSDFVFIGITLWMTASLEAWIKDPAVRTWIYIIGGFGLIMMGIMLLRSKKQTFQNDNLATTGNYMQGFIGGFVVNSMSPFTLFFWVGAAILLRMQDDNPMWYYLGLMLSLAMGDFTKAWLAPKLTKWIKEKYIYWVQVIAGVLIAVTGLYMMWLGFFE